MSIIISIISGIITGIGLGGGTFLIIGLTMFLNVEQKIAQSANLFFFIPTAITSICINSRNKNIRWNYTIHIGIFSLIGSIIGAIITTKIKVQILKKLFGIFIGMIAIYEIYTLIKSYIINKKSNNNRKRKEDMLEKDV